MNPVDFAKLISRFGAELLPKMRGPGQGEARLRGPVNDLLKRVGRGYGLDVQTHDEVPVAELRSRPDIAVDAAMGRIGYIELKAPDKGVPETETWRGDTRDRKQWDRLKVLPNLIYCDGQSWALYRKGTLVGRVGRVTGDLARAGDRLKPADNALQDLLDAFLHWPPPEPSSLRAIVAEVAPLCRLLRDQVTETLAMEATSPRRQKPFQTLASEWRNILFPVSGIQESEMDFADSYAQTVTFALLLARVDGISFEGRSPAGIAEQLAKQHSLLGEALGILAKSSWARNLSVVGTLQRIIGNIDWSKVKPGKKKDTHAELYETFLAYYDPELRQRSGTYYTPVEVARPMVRLVDEVLRTRLKRKRGFAAPDVVTLDPAMGAGTFLAAVLDQAVANLQRERRSATYPASHVTELFEQRLIGFELQAAPFAVAELRLHAALRNHQVEIPREEPRFLTNTLDDPDKLPFPEYGLMYDVLKDASERANRVKRDVNVWVVIGNPPWREKAKGAAPWLEERRESGKLVNAKAKPSMDEFRPTGKARLAYNLSNLWTFFWRWATWKAFEANDPAGVVALITPSAYLTSAAYSGMRRYLRELADEAWIIDLSPEQHRSGIGTRVFPTTQHAICIGIFVRTTQPRPKAKVHYVEIPGSQKEKFDVLDKLTLKSSSWRTCPETWEAAFRPSDGAWEEYPLVGELMPWQRTGVTSNRNWVWAPSKEILMTRWHQLILADEQRKPILFKNTDSRRVELKYPAQPGVPSGEREIAKERDPTPRTTRAGIHIFDRQYLILDRRVVDRPRSELWQVSGPDQIYTCEQHAHPVDSGPGLVFSALVPGAHYYNNRGGRVLALYRDADGQHPNLPPRLLDKLSGFIGIRITAADFLAYVAGVVAHAGYTTTFREQLRTPGIRVPITMHRALWCTAVRLGQEIIWLHTFGERFVDEAAGRPSGPPRECRASYRRPVPSGEGDLPDSYRYDDTTETLHVGAGEVHPVAPEVWGYEVGGKGVVSKWLDFRMRRPRHRRVTSPLDEVNMTRWTAEFDDQLLEVLEAIWRCVALEPAQREVLDEVCAGPVVTVADLEREGVFPVPASARKPPSPSQGLFSGD
jgi:hypothetical protein